METVTEKAVIIGAGPAGLTAVSELLEHTPVHPVLFEESDEIGGISKTVKYKGNCMDIGGHRFFSKNETVMNWWKKVMCRTDEDPEREFLLRNRVSRIFFLRKFFSYPISLSWETFRNLGFINALRSGFGYCVAQISPLKENTLEDFYINRFGHVLYQLFFEDYTTKVWGRHPSCLGADWGSQRVKGVSLSEVVKDYFRKKLRISTETETSLIEEFYYPKFGPGQLWECVADDVVKKGAELYKNHTVRKINVNGNRVESVEVESSDGVISKEDCDYLLSSMPIKDLIQAIHGIEIPQKVKFIAENLPYRDFITVGLLVEKLKIRSNNGERVPDTWIYIQERDVKIGRLQLFNNWSPYLVADEINTIWLGLEYFCSEGDELWEMKKDDFIQMAIDELVKIEIIERDSVLDAHYIKVKKAYPAYFGTYYELHVVREFLDSIENLFCIGRNGQHRYNNMDHSMLTAMEAVKNIRLNSVSKQNVWDVNTEKEYHEKK
jgi:protoporphyrinogen oxidase